MVSHYCTNSSILTPFFTFTIFNIIYYIIILVVGWGKLTYLNFATLL